MPVSLKNNAMYAAINSSNITALRVGAEFDIYNRKVTFKDLSTYAGSSGSGRFNVQGISFLLEDQEGVVLSAIDFTDPAKFIVPGVATEFEIDLSSLSYPFLFQTYKIQVAVKDQDGVVYYTPETFKKICQPSNITDDGYVPGIFQVLSNCADSVLSVKELTPLIYSGKTPLLTTKTGTLSYPSGTISAVSFTGTPFSNNTIYTGEYRVRCTTVSEYDMDDDVSVFVTYLTNNVFDITCANKIADLICCMVELQRTYLKNCNNATGRNAKQKLDEITVPFLMGLTKEINGQDASSEADLIRKTLNCDCGSSSMRQVEFTPINPSSTNIVLGGVGGTTIPSPVVNGNTKTYSIASNVYQVVKGNTGDLAFTIETDNTTQYLVKYKITFNYNTMASNILNAIAVDPALVSLLNSLVATTGAVDLSGLDGKCVIDLSVVNYYLTQNVNSGTKVVSLSTSTTDYGAPANLYANNAASVQSWLNGLGVGTFTVTYNSGVFSILSLNNVNQISAIEFSSPDITVVFQRTNATLVSVLQAIVDYLCTLTSLSVTLGNTITLWRLDYNSNPLSVSYTNGQSQAALNQGIADSIYNIVNTISTLTGITCDKIKAVFSDSSASFGTSDRIYGTLGGACAAITDKQVAQLVIAALNKYSDVKADFCTVTCTSPGTCPDISGISMAMAGSSIGIYGVTFNSAPSAVQQLTVKYKRYDITTYTVATSALQVFPNGTINGSSPFLIAGVSAGITYDIQIVNNCGGTGFTGQISVPTGTAYSGTYLYENILYNLCGATPVTLYTGAPFGIGQIVYTDVALTVPLAGYSYISDNTGDIFTINSSTGEVTANTGTSCTNGVANEACYTNNLSLCGGCAADTYVYTNGALSVGGTVYTDVSLTTPLTGYSYLTDGATSKIYTLNSITGVITGDTGLLCGTYSGTFRRGNSDLLACAAATETLYSSAPFAPGIIMYTDVSKTVLASGSSYIADSNDIVYLINTSTGVVGSAYGVCTPP